MTHNDFMIKYAGPALGLISRNGRLRQIVNKLVNRGQFDRAAKIEGIRTGEQAGRLMAKGKLAPGHVFNADGTYSTMNNAAIRNRKSAISMMRQGYDPATGSIHQNYVNKLPESVRNRFGISPYGQTSIQPGTSVHSGVRPTSGHFEAGYGSGYDYYAPRIHDGLENPVLRGMQQATGKDPFSLRNNRSIYNMINEVERTGANRVDPSKFIQGLW